MSVVVKLSPGERFLNWYPENTKIYFRGQSGKSYEEQREIDYEFANAFNEFANHLIADALENKESAQIKALRKCLKEHMALLSYSPHMQAEASDEALEMLEIVFPRWSDNE